MKTMPGDAAALLPSGGEAEAQEAEFKPWTAEQARDLARRQPSLSPWRVVALQAVVGLLVALLAWAVTGRTVVGWSAGYGALAVVLPAALFARGLMRRVPLVDPKVRAMSAAFGFLVWEMIKIALTVAMLVAAPRLVAGLSWPAMLVGLVLSIKVYWVALFLHPKRGT